MRKESSPTSAVILTIILLLLIMMANAPYSILRALGLARRGTVQISLAAVPTPLSETTPGDPINTGEVFSLPPDASGMGVRLDYTRLDYTRQGIVVREVVPHSPADKAGLQAGDIIYTINGALAIPDSFISDQVQRYGPGDVIILGIIRQGQRMSVNVELEE